MTTIFLSYSRGDDEPFVKRLYEDLSARGFDVWFDRVSMPSRQLTFFQEIRDAIAAHERLLLVIGPKARTSEYVTQEWKNALEMGKCVNAIVRLNGYRDDGGTIDGYDLMPEELKLIHSEDFRDDSRYAEHLANLTRQLSDPAPPLGKLVAVPTLPLHYLAQRDRLLKLRDTLLSDLQRPVVVTGTAARVGVQGMGGIGKSVLAAALARDPEVRRAFPDGIFWIGVGQQPNLVELQRFISRELGDEALFNDLHAGKQKLKELLAERAALLILDDVWQSTDANAFDALGPRCKLLLTTRDAGLVSTMAGAGYQVQLPSEAEALALLANAARVPVESLPPLASEIVAECGRLPLALALCGSMASKGYLWERILRALREARLELIADRHEIEEHHRSIWCAMEVSVQVLPPDEQCRFAELAVFATDAAIPEEALLTLWSHTGGLDELAGADLLVAFNERSLVQLDRSAGPVGSVRVRASLHDLLHDFATRLAAQLFGSPATLHDQLLDAYSKQCPNGWPTGPNDGYFFQRICHHLADAERTEELIRLLFNYDWLQNKVNKGLVNELSQDYDKALLAIPTNQRQRRALEMVQEGIRLSAHVIAKDKFQLASQLVGRISQCEESEVKKLINAAKAWRGTSWLCPLRECLTSPGSPFLRTLRGHNGDVSDVAFTPNSRCIISADRYRDELLEEIFRKLPGHPVVDSHGRRIVPASSKLRIWNCERGDEIREIDSGDSSRIVFCITQDGKRLISSATAALVVWDTETWNPIRRLELPHQDGVTVVTLPDNRRLVSASYDSGFILWDLDSGLQIRRFEGKPGEFGLSGDGTKILLCGHHGEVCFREIDENRELWSWPHHRCPNCIAVAPDGRRAICGFGGGWPHPKVEIWDLEHGVVLHQMHGDRWEGVAAVAVSPDSKIGFTSSQDGTVTAWGMENGKRKGMIKPHHKGATAMTLSRDTRYLALAIDSDVQIWSVDRWLNMRESRSHSREVRVVAITPDGGYALTDSPENHVRLWDMNSGELLREMKGHTRLINALIVDSTGKLAISGSDDLTVRIWSLDSGECRVLAGHKYGVSKISTSPDGYHLLSFSSGDGDVRIWNLKSGALQRFSVE